MNHPPKLKDRTGWIVGRWTVIELHSKKRNAYYWLCRCKCGTLKPIRGTHLDCGSTHSCGCKVKEGRHGHTKHKGSTKEYGAWSHMKRRCLSRTGPKWKSYGGRGITFCERWKTFENFLSDMGKAPDGLTLERVDTNGNYEPSNCIWASYKDQQNNRTNNKIIEFCGCRKTLARWSDSLGMNYSMLQARLDRGWPVEIAFTKPSGYYYLR